MSVKANRPGESATLQVRILGDVDSETGWQEAVWYSGADFDPEDFDPEDFLTAESIKVWVKTLPIGISETIGERAAEDRLQVTTRHPLDRFDRLAYNGQTYEVETEPDEHLIRGRKRYWSAVMVRLT